MLKYPGSLSRGQNIFQICVMAEKGMGKTKQIGCKKYNELWNKAFPKVSETSVLICPPDVNTLNAKSTFTFFVAQEEM